MTRAEVKMEACICCGRCVDSCFMGALQPDGGGRPVLRYGDDCQVCGVCETLCPTGALLIVPDWAAKHQPRLLAEGGTVE